MGTKRAGAACDQSIHQTNYTHLDFDLKGCFLLLLRSIIRSVMIKSPPLSLDRVLLCLEACSLPVSLSLSARLLALWGSVLIWDLIHFSLSLPLLLSGALSVFLLSFSLSFLVSESLSLLLFLSEPPASLPPPGSAHSSLSPQCCVWPPRLRTPMAGGVWLHRPEA